MSAEEQKQQESKEQAAHMTVVEPAETLQVTSPEAAEASLKNRMEEIARLRAALESGDKAEPQERASDKAVEDQQKDTDEAQKPEEAPAEGGQEEQQPKPEKAETDWKAEADRLKAEQRKKDGIRGGELEKLRKQVEQLTAQLQEKSTAAEARKEPESKISYPEDVEREPTEEELVSEYGANYEQEVGREWAVKNLKAINRRTWKARQEIERELEGKVKAVIENDRVQKVSETLRASVEKLVPGAAEIDAKAAENGFAEFLDGDHPEFPGFTRREVAERLVQQATRGVQPEASVERLARIYADFDGKPIAKKPASSSAMKPEEKTTGSPKAAENAKPDMKQYIMPSGRSTDKKPETGQFVTVSSAIDELRKSRGTSFEEIRQRILDKARRGEVIAG